jgi:3-oxosteroid 1-dehydrogenase
VIGVLVRRDDKVMRIRARRGVLLAAGGFAHNAAMRDKYLDPGGAPDWSYANPGDTGEVMQMAMQHGAATALMDDAIWMVAQVINGVPVVDQERQRPGSIIVDADGNRFCNESGSYIDVIKAQLARNHTTKAVPAWLIFDDAFRERYVFQSGKTGVIPQEWFDRGDYLKAATLGQLAMKCEIDPDGLLTTIERFNPNAAAGVDPDYHRGENAYNRFLGDPKWKPNNCLAPIARPPFYATSIVPSDVGTRGGVLADEHGRVVHRSGGIIPGLYATGNGAASVMGGTYPCAGGGLGNSAVFGYVAALHASTVLMNASH